MITDLISVLLILITGFVVPELQIFLLMIKTVIFSGRLELCGNFAVLDAGDGFDSYVWVRDEWE
jgi:hypothetical protein